MQTLKSNHRRITDKVSDPNLSVYNDIKIRPNLLGPKKKTFYI